MSEHIEPGDEHTPSEQQPPLLHVLPAQQRSPGPPQGEQMLVPPSFTRWQYAFDAHVPPGQHDMPGAPQALPSPGVTPEELPEEPPLLLPPLLLLPVAS